MPNDALREISLDTAPAWLKSEADHSALSLEEHA